MDWTPLVQVIENVLSIDAGTLVFAGMAFAFIAWLIGKAKSYIYREEEE